MSSKQKLVRLAQRWAVPILLIVIALRQLFLAQTMGLSPWKGGGFGMFASLDKSQSRLLVIQGITSTGTKIQIKPKSLTKIISSQQLRKLKSIPAPPLMQQVAHQVLESDIGKSSSNQTNGIEPAASEQQLLPLQAVTIQVWHLHYHPDTHQVRYEPLSEEVTAQR